ncbi:hypothetical protein CE91St62_22530 [Lachnospiraceae bacterium]|uniref:nuclear transport factor 2 family protein n=1 Tax=Extibacter sp. GGCC_0201 TaxID=2731209 RepID=UPI001AA0D752|nr:nuclear transport factor 2 family protein [Extibacter sp. GGCC_0201]MBO1719138.1 SnoaL-like domain-containing protein [Extibacter sp. GGCC_0201]BDF34188.1 hypothetical protein CE91St61_22630 [Lachnospiraceae bacterium]BDF38192.1 hypothetical protein CE91St62_22530 [Lachnospiraceae bacterium]
MAVKIMSREQKDDALIMEVIRNARKQDYTPDLLCELQKVVETKYYYWWLMDMKKEECARELFAKDFSYYYNGYLVTEDGAEQAKTSKWTNSSLVTMHMGHQPMVWLIDQTHARGIFQYEDHHVSIEDGSVIETWMVYCDDFKKYEDGSWHISTMRMYPKQSDGRYRNPFPPDGWTPEGWEQG